VTDEAPPLRPRSTLRHLFRRKSRHSLGIAMLKTASLDHRLQILGLIPKTSKRWKSRNLQSLSRKRTSWPPVLVLLQHLSVNTRIPLLTIPEPCFPFQTLYFSRVYALINQSDSQLDYCQGLVSRLSICCAPLLVFYFFTPKNVLLLIADCQERLILLYFDNLSLESCFSLFLSLY
jgi:hypothetical protein